MYRNQKGFSLLHVLIIILSLGIILGSGVYILHTKRNKSSQDSSSIYVSKDAYLEKVSPDKRLANINKSVGSLSDCGAVPEAAVATTINSCFEEAFSQCKPVFATAKSSQAGMVTRYVIIGKDHETKHCVGGFYYSESDDPAYKGLGTVCALDTSVKPFLQAMSQVNSGEPQDVESHCKQPANPRHI